MDRGIFEGQFARSVRIVAVLWFAPVPALAVSLQETRVVCPLDGQAFTAATYGSYVSGGTRLDGMPLLVGTPNILPPPVCPDSGFVVYREDFSMDEIARLREIVASEGFHTVRDDTALEFPVAAYVAEALGEPSLIVASLHLRATWESDVYAPEEYERLTAKAIVWLDILLEWRESYDIRPAEIVLIAANLERQLGRFDAALARLDTISAGMLGGRADLAAAFDLTRSLVRARDSDRWRTMPGS